MLARADDYPGYERLEDVAPRGALAPVGPPKPWRNKFGAIRLGQIDNPDLSEFTWIIEDWLPECALSLTAGARQSGKTFWKIHAGMCIAHGHEFFGKRVEPGLVIYQSGEGQRGFLKRMRAWRRHHGIEFTDDTPFVPLLNSLDLFNDKEQGGDTDALIADIKHIQSLYPGVPLRMVVIDTVSTAAPGMDEISGRDTGKLLANANRVKDACDTHVSLVMHLNAGGTKVRGHTSFEANADTVITITENAETKVRTVTLSKQKDGEAGLKMQYELMRVVLGEDKHGKEITSCVCLPVGEKAAIRMEEERKGWRLSPGEEIFMRALFEAEKRSGEPVPVDWDLPTKVRAVIAYDDVKRIYAASNPSDDLSPDLGEEEAATALTRHREALKKKLQRVREALTGSGVVGFAKRGEKSFVWWTGRPLRAFPHTVPREVEQPPLNSDLASSEIPF